ncbi:MAG: prepilin peptidase [Burkholderiaceae bacterium]
MFVLARLAWHDLNQRRLPNVWVGVFGFLFLVHAALSPMGWTDVGWHAAIAVLTFVVTTVFFALGWMGGGDVKLFTALMLWAGPILALPAIVITTLAGGVLAVAGLMARFFLQRQWLTPLSPCLRRLDARRGVPYGVALSVAGVYVLYFSIP